MKIRNGLFMKKPNLWIMLCALCICMLSGCKSGDYSKAQELYDNKQYEEAFEMFLQLGDYKKSGEYLLGCRDKLNYTRSQCDANAKLMKSYGDTYVFMSGMCGTSVSDGWVKVDLQKTYNGSDMPETDGKHIKDFVVWYNMDMPIEGYVLFKCGGAIVQEAYYCKLDCFGDDYKDFDINNVDGTRYIVGKCTELTM